MLWQENKGSMGRGKGTLLPWFVYLVEAPMIPRGAVWPVVCTGQLLPRGCNSVYEAEQGDCLYVS